MKISHPCNECFLLAIWTFVLLCACSAVGAASEPRAFILDRGTNSVIALAPENAAILGTVSFEGGHLTTMIQVPNSKRLAVFDQGPGKYSLRFGWHPEGKASMSFVDMGSMKITSQVQLGWASDRSWRRMMERDSRSYAPDTPLKSPRKLCPPKRS